MGVGCERWLGSRAWDVRERRGRHPAACVKATKEQHAEDGSPNADGRPNANGWPDADGCLDAE